MRPFDITFAAKNPPFRESLGRCIMEAHEGAVYE